MIIGPNECDSKMYPYTTFDHCGHPGGSLKKMVKNVLNNLIRVSALRPMGLLFKFLGNLACTTKFPLKHPNTKSPGYDPIAACINCTEFGRSWNARYRKLHTCLNGALSFFTRYLYDCLLIFLSGSIYLLTPGYRSLISFWHLWKVIILSVSIILLPGKILFIVIFRNGCD